MCNITYLRRSQLNDILDNDKFVGGGVTIPLYNSQILRYHDLAKKNKSREQQEARNFSKKKKDHFPSFKQANG